MAWLYLLVSEQVAEVKIGISVDPCGRASQLPVAVDLQRSFEIELQDGFAGNLERFLHFYFRDDANQCRPVKVLQSGSSWLHCRKSSISYSASKRGLGSPGSPYCC